MDQTSANLRSWTRLKCQSQQFSKTDKCFDVIHVKLPHVLMFALIFAVPHLLSSAPSPCVSHPRSAPGCIYLTGRNTFNDFCMSICHFWCTIWGNWSPSTCAQKLYESQTSSPTSFACKSMRNYQAHLPRQHSLNRVFVYNTENIKVKNSKPVHLNAPSLKKVSLLIIFK